MEEMNVFDWLNQEPLASDLMSNEDGSVYIPIEIIKQKLDHLDFFWSTANFNHFFYKTEDNAVRCSGSVELSVSLPVLVNRNQVEFKVRKVVGSATFDVQKYYSTGNSHWGETCLSLCIVSAAKNISPFFGKNLNKNLSTEEKGAPNVDKAHVKKVLDTAKKAIENANNTPR